MRATLATLVVLTAAGVADVAGTAAFVIPIVVGRDLVIIAWTEPILAASVTAPWMTGETTDPTTAGDAGGLTRVGEAAMAYLTEYGWTEPTLGSTAQEPVLVGATSEPTI